MAGNFRDFEARFRRRDVLAYLLISRDFSANDSLLRSVMREQGYLVSGEQLRVDVAWLAEQHLVRLREIGEVQIVTLLERGRDIAEGAEQLEGVALPDPSKR